MFLYREERTEEEGVVWLRMRSVNEIGSWKETDETEG